VRLMEALPHSDPPKPAELADCRAWLHEFMSARVAPLLELALARERCIGNLMLIGTGGTAGILAGLEHQLTEYDRARVDGTVLGFQRVRYWVSRLWSLPLQARRQLRGLPPQRADVILTGAAIYEAVMASLHFAELRITTHGLRFAAVMD
jgi:exopolyphosphatase/guanosine-5'-triphosphate,3'-diphosphate pyrophosphatase